MIADDIVWVPWDVLKEFVAQVFRRLGLSSQDADLAADVIVITSLRGVDSHGMFLFPAYVKRLKLKLIEPQAHIRVVEENGSALVVDGGNGLGQVVACRAMEMCVKKAHAVGVGMATIRASNHFGSADYYAMMALEQDMIGVAASNGTAVMAPWGAAEPYFATNPIAVAVPCDRAYPVVFDMATSITARSKIIQAQQRGEEIPIGWAIDLEGRPTQDPAKALAGAVLPMAGPKGSGLALVIEILSGILSGGAFGPHIRGLHEDLTGPQGTCHFLAAIDIGRFVPVSEFKKRMDTMIVEIKQLRPAPEIEEVRVPGERRARAENQRSVTGIPLERGFLEELKSLGDEFDVLLNT